MIENIAATVGEVVGILIWIVIIYMIYKYIKSKSKSQ